MALNPFFRQEVDCEQRLVQDLVNEHLRMYGSKKFITCPESTWVLKL